jgi:hypothetical protein
VPDRAEEDTVTSSQPYRTAALALGAALLLPACSGESTLAAPEPSDTPTTAAPTASPTPSEAPTAAPTSSRPPATAAPTGTRAVAVYYLRADGSDSRLYREVHRRPATTGVVADAVRAVIGEAPRDDDYTSLWPKGTRVLGARVDGTTAVVDLSREAERGGVGAAFEGASMQQLVWTVTEAAPSVTGVRLLVEGRPFGGWGHVDGSARMERAPQEDTLAPVWLEVGEGATLRPGDRFGGEATVFEATVSWELVRGTTVVREGFATAREGAPGRGDWSAVLPDVPAGDYVLRAFESSAEDGRPLHVDDKRVRVA